MSERGQLYTLEGIFAGLVILLGLLFALQATTTTPSAAGASNPAAIQDDDIYVEDFVTSLNRSTLKDGVLYWGSNGFYCTGSGDREFYTGTWNDSGNCSGQSPTYDTDMPPPNTFGKLIEQRFGDQYAYNVRVAYAEDSGDIRYQRMVYQGEPGAGAVSGSTSIVLENESQLRGPDGSNVDSLENQAEEFYAPPLNSGSSNDGPYNVLHVEVTIWRG